MGNYFLLKRQIRQVRREVRAQIASETHTDELRMLIFHEQYAQEQLDWKRDDEFEFEEEMYDVMDEEHCGDSVYYYCWPDKKESRLNRKLTALLYDTLDLNQPVQQHKNQIRILFKKHFIGSDDGMQLADFGFIQNSYADYLFSITSIYPEITGPPPKA